MQNSAFAYASCATIYRSHERIEPFVVCVFESEFVEVHLRTQMRVELQLLIGR